MASQDFIVTSNKRKMTLETGGRCLEDFDKCFEITQGYGGEDGKTFPSGDEESNFCLDCQASCINVYKMINTCVSGPKKGNHCSMEDSKLWCGGEDLCEPSIRSVRDYCALFGEEDIEMGQQSVPPSTSLNFCSMAYYAARAACSMPAYVYDRDYCQNQAAKCMEVCAPDKDVAPLGSKQAKYAEICWQSMNKHISDHEMYSNNSPTAYQTDLDASDDLYADDGSLYKTSY